MGIIRKRISHIWEPLPLELSLNIEMAPFDSKRCVKTSRFVTVKHLFTRSCACRTKRSAMAIPTRVNNTFTNNSLPNGGESPATMYRRSSAHRAEIGRRNSERSVSVVLLGGTGPNRDKLALTATALNARKRKRKTAVQLHFVVVMPSLSWLGPVGRN